MLIIQADALEKIYSHARREYPEECCGIMLGRRLGERREAYRVIWTRNMADECGSSTHFLMDSLEIARLELLAEEEKQEIIGFYHSHPDYEAIVSDMDVHYMITGYSYVIVSVKNGICDSLKSYERQIQTDSDAKEEKILIKEKENEDFGICISNAADFCKPPAKD